MLNYNHNDYVYQITHCITYIMQQFHRYIDKSAGMVMLCSTCWQDLCEQFYMHCMGCQQVTACDICILAYQTRFYMACAYWMLSLCSL